MKGLKKIYLWTIIAVPAFAWFWLADVIVPSAGTQTNGPTVERSRASGIRVAALDFARRIDTTGVPFKGVDNAPVVIAVFSDFE